MENLPQKKIFTYPEPDFTLLALPFRVIVFRSVLFFTIRQVFDSRPEKRLRRNKVYILVSVLRNGNIQFRVS